MDERYVSITSEGLPSQVIKTRLTDKELGDQLYVHNEWINMVEHIDAGLVDKMDIDMDVEYDFVQFLVNNGLAIRVEFDTFCMDVYG